MRVLSFLPSSCTVYTSLQALSEPVGSWQNLHQIYVHSPAPRSITICYSQINHAFSQPVLALCTPACTYAMYSCLCLHYGLLPIPKPRHVPPACTYTTYSCLYFFPVLLPVPMPCTPGYTYSMYSYLYLFNVLGPLTAFLTPYRSSTWERESGLRKCQYMN